METVFLHELSVCKIQVLTNSVKLTKKHSLGVVHRQRFKHGVQLTEKVLKKVRFLLFHDVLIDQIGRDLELL